MSLGTLYSFFSLSFANSNFSRYTTVPVLLQLITAVILVNTIILQPLSSGRNKYAGSLLESSKLIPLVQLLSASSIMAWFRATSRIVMNLFAKRVCLLLMLKHRSLIECCSSPLHQLHPLSMVHSSTRILLPESALLSRKIRSMVCARNLVVVLPLDWASCIHLNLKARSPELL
jgi:hypothetical protein